MHQLKDRKGRDVTAKCGAKVPIEQTTAWTADVTCTDCVPKRQRLDWMVEHAERHGMYEATARPIRTR